MIHSGKQLDYAYRHEPDANIRERILLLRRVRIDNQEAASVAELELHRSRLLRHHKMKAVGLYKHLPIEDPQSLVDLDIQEPNHPTGHDLLVAIKAISVNPLDTKVRRGTIPPPENENIPRILGWDVAGEVIAVGSDCTLFDKGDAVYYAGSISRQGTNCEVHLVDERIVGRKPKSLSFEETAAMPLTTITAWETLYDRLSLYSDTIKRKTALPEISASDDGDKNKRDSPSSILIIGGTGGSIAIQLAKNLVNHSTSLSTSSPGINVIATASRSESVEGCKKMGADYVINHHKDLKSQIKEIIGIMQTIFSV